MVTMLDLQSGGRRFDSRPFCFHVITHGQVVYSFSSVSKQYNLVLVKVVVMLWSWEVNRILGGKWWQLPLGLWLTCRLTASRPQSILALVLISSTGLPLPYTSHHTLWIVELGT